jgi:DNA polymerase phi
LQSSILTESSTATHEDWEVFLDKICAQARTGPWLREECGSMLCDYVAGAPSSKIEQQAQVLTAIEKYSTNELLQTPEGVALWLMTVKAYPELKLSKDIWHKRDPLHSKERSRLARIMCDTGNSNTEEPAAEQKKKIKGGTWKPQPNFAWRVILQEAFEKFPSPSKLRQFCIEVFDSACSKLMNLEYWS